MIKEDEKKFFKTCLKFCSVSEGYVSTTYNQYFRYVPMKFKDCDKSFYKSVTPRDIIIICKEFIHPKRAEYLLNKWSDKGFYDYGVALDLGWFESEEFFGEYLEIYNSVKEEEDKTFENQINYNKQKFIYLQEMAEANKKIGEVLEKLASEEGG